MSAEIVDIRQHAPASRIEVEAASLMSEQDGKHVHHADYVVVRLGAEAIALPPAKAREFAAAVVEAADNCKETAAS